MPYSALSDKAYKRVERTVTAVVFLLLLILYWVTCPPTVSLWDCPEYVAGAVRLTVGHPPGNPVWLLIERIVTMWVPPDYAALAVNMSSGLFTALAGMIMAKCIFIGAVWVLKPISGRHTRLHPYFAGGAALTGALIFGVGDSVWYSAVEAEVYALSLFLSALSVWLMLKWAMAESVAKAWRYLILLAYVFGLSLGVHQLNLLCIPALAVIWAARREIGPWWKIVLIFMLSLVAVGCILVGMMPGSIALAAQFELFAVNTLDLPYLWGVGIYVTSLAGALLLALFVTARSSNRGLLALAIYPAIFLSGLFIFSSHFLIGAGASALVALLMVRGAYFKPHRLNLAFWMLAMLLTGYSAYAIIPIRGHVASPINCALPDEPFSFAAYQAREQYGGAPLLYGHTPYSRPLLIEDFEPDSTPVYRRIASEKIHPLMQRAMPGMKLRSFTGTHRLDPRDSLSNREVIQNGGEERGKYIVSGYRTRTLLTPELDMWFPRLTDRDPGSLASLADWSGMTDRTADTVRISETLDSLGRPAGRLGADGERHKALSYRPTYLQNLQYFLTYQVGYMYLRYLMWNFSGRQNDVHSQGEVEHGNFITGFPMIDDAMLGAEGYLPPDDGVENRGRNRYFLLPFILGILGIVWLLRINRRGRLACGIIAVLFVLTGIAIVVYLNQSPGEARERDYTFLGSYMAFAAWISAGALCIAGFLTREMLALRNRLLRRKRGPDMRLPGATFKFRRMAVICGFIPSLLLAAWMGYENFDDHDRRGRLVASAMPANILSTLEKDAVLFVDGDNHTFPFWYAQEVEGIRRDVKVINVSYLGMPRYVAALKRPWEEAPALRSAFTDAQLIYNALYFPTLDLRADSIADAVAALRAMADREDPRFDVSHVRLKIEDDSILFPLRRLIRTPGGRIADFRRLMMLDLIASNASGSEARPFYWLHSVPAGNTLELDHRMRETIFARRLSASTTGKDDKDKEPEQILQLKPLNDPRREVYMDGTPAGIASRIRADLVAASLRLLEGGDTTRAYRTALMIDSIAGSDPRSYMAVRMADTIFLTSRRQADLFARLAESMGDTVLARKSRDIMTRDSLRQTARVRYYKALPPRLRRVSTMAPKENAAGR